MLPARRHEISRLEAFSDAVFGFALALLVVSSDPPASYAQLVDRMLGVVRCSSRQSRRWRMR
jgi:uncharacterized membrane protein